MAPKRTPSPAKSRSSARVAAKASEAKGKSVVWSSVLYYIVSAMCFFMGCLHESATPVVMGSLAEGKGYFPQLDHFGDATWKPGEVAFVLAVQYQVGGLMVFVLSWMFFMAARNPAHAMLAYAGIALSAATALGALMIGFLYDDPNVGTTPMLPVWTVVTTIAVVGALLDLDKRATTKRK